jgi:septum formation protein
MFLEENKKIKLILASASPRRSGILDLLKINFEAIPPFNCKEEVFEDPYTTVIKNSIKKSKNIADYVKINKIDFSCANDYRDIIICGFDTIVYFENKYFFKPKNIDEARGFISSFSGKTHSVVSGVSIYSFAEDRVETGFEETSVTFRKLNGKDIEHFLANEYFLDKAGAYNIEGYGAFLVKKIKGCFFNVAGLPIYRFLSILNKFGYDLNNF